jgi:hypothetical protein
MEIDMLKQSERQLNASVGQKLTWVFAERGAADATKALFQRADNGREKIDIEVWPWPVRKK